LTIQNQKEEPATPNTAVKIDIEKSPTVAVPIQANNTVIDPPKNLSEKKEKENNNEKQTNENQSLIPKSPELKASEEIKAPPPLLYPAEYETLFKSVKTGAPIHAMYFTVSVARSFLVVVFLVALVAYPLAQTIMILIINLQFFGYLLKFRSFKFRYLFVQEVGNELSLILAYIFMLSLAIFDATDTPLGTIDARNAIGFGMLVINSMTFVWNVCFQLYDVYLILKEMYETIKTAWHEYKKKKAAAATTPTLLTSEKCEPKPDASTAPKEEKKAVEQENTEQPLLDKSVNKEESPIDKKEALSDKEEVPIDQEDAPIDKSEIPIDQGSKSVSGFDTFHDKSMSFEKSFFEIQVMENFKAFEAFHRPVE
jgi:hypothetical protein